MPSTTGTASDTTANHDSGRSRAFAAGRPPKEATVAKAPEAGRTAAPAKTRGAMLDRAGERPSATYPRAPAPPPADEIVRLLVEQLAPLLGLDAARISIGGTPDAGEPRGAASGHRLELTGDHRSPHLETVVAHEL